MQTNNIRILIVDDVESSLRAVEAGIKKSGYQVTSTQQAEEAISLIEQNNYHAIISDLKMPKFSGEDILAAALKKDPNSVVIIMTGFSSIESAVELMQKGAFYYLKKPINIKELRLLLERALKQQDLSEKVANLNKQLDQKFVEEGLITRSKVMAELLEQALLAAKSKSTVLVQGESGTGKEVITRIIHGNSNRKNETFIAVNCSAFTESLLESQLFGHERGAFTGASTMKKGVFESANGGTLFLDEIGEMNLSMQSKLLRVLEEREFMRVGSTKAIKSDVRIIAASNKNLKELRDSGQFREDLFYRLSVFEIALPPLRERKEDIPYLLKHFLRHFAIENEQSAASISAEALDLLQYYDWPGNVRELRNLSERLSIIFSGKVVQKKDIQNLLNIEKQADISIDVGASMPDIERKAILETLEFAKGNRTQTAKILKIGLRTLQRKLKEYGIN